MANEDTPIGIDQRSRNFSNLSPLGKLHVVRDEWKKGYYSQQYRILRRITAREILAMPPDDREKQDISVVVYAEKDNEGKIVVAHPEFANYAVNICFPYGQGQNRKMQFVSTARYDLVMSEDRAMLSDLVEIDTLITEHADIRPETSIDHAGNQARMVKNIDSKIKQQKDIASSGTQGYDVEKAAAPLRYSFRFTNSQLDKLGLIKTETLLAYFSAADKAEEEFPEAGVLYDIDKNRPNDNWHKTLVMFLPKQTNFLNRLLDPKLRPLFGENYDELTTNINIGPLQKDWAERQRGSNLDRHRIGAELYERIRD